MKVTYVRGLTSPVCDVKLSCPPEAVSISDTQVAQLIGTCLYVDT